MKRFDSKNYARPPTSGRRKTNQSSCRRFWKATLSLSTTKWIRQPLQVAMTAFQARSLRDGESVEECSHDLHRLLEQAIPPTEDSVQGNKDLLKHQFIAGLPQGVRQQVTERDATSETPLTLQRTMQLAKRLLRLVQRQPSPRSKDLARHQRWTRWQAPSRRKQKWRLD